MGINILRQPNSTIGIVFLIMSSSRPVIFQTLFAHLSFIASILNVCTPFLISKVYVVKNALPAQLYHLVILSYNYDSS